MRNKILLFLLTFIGISQIAAASSVRDKYNFEEIKTKLTDSNIDKYVK